MNLSPSEKRLLHLLFLEGQLSRKALAEKLHLTGAAMTLASQNLLSQGLIQTMGSLPSPRAGRREENLALNPKRFTLAGLDLHAHSVYLVLLDFAGNVIEQERFLSLAEAIQALLEKAPSLPEILGVGVEIRGFSSLEKFQQEQPEIAKELASIPYPTHLLNNVESLAYLHAMQYPEDANFLLLKYGPGVGSSIFVSAHPLRGSDGSIGEIGHWFIQPGLRLEEAISFEGLLGEEMEEKEGSAMLLSHPDILKKCIASLGLALLDANYLLSLDKIILSGLLLSTESVFASLTEQIAAYDPTFDLSKVVVYPDYESINERKSGLQVFADLVLL
jgi:transcriptional regulator of PTS gene